jgi:MraZ protein
MARLLGSHPGSVDAKGRIVIPAPLRPALGERVVLTRGVEPYVCVFPEAAWERLETAISQLSRFDPESAWIRRAFGDSAEERVVDEQGRILVGEQLREYAGLAKEALTIGAVDLLELWNPTRYHERRQAEVTSDWLGEAARRVSL